LPRAARRRHPRISQNDPPDILTARRVVAKPAHEVLAAMESLFLAEPYRLLLVEQRGDVLAGGTMVFDIHSNASPFNPGFGYQMQDSGVIAGLLDAIAGKAHGGWLRGPSGTGLTSP